MVKRIVLVALGLAAFGATAPAVMIDLNANWHPIATRSTTVEKNQAWPIKGHITMEPCTENLCLNV
jgi:hypothetical protein